MKKLAQFGAGAALGLLTVVVLAQEPSSADDVVNRAKHVCAACHGEGGNSQVPVYPKLAGQQRMYTIEQLKLFRSQKRSESDQQAYMWGISALLDDSTIEGLADYFQAQPASPGKPADPRQSALGRRIFAEGIPARKIPACASCHGASGEGGSVFPRIAGQHATYTALQLNQFKTRLRPYAVVMAGVVKNMTREEMQAVAAYAQGL